MLLWHLGILSLGFFVPIRRFGGVWAAGVGVGCGIAGSGGGGGEWATGGVGAGPGRDGRPRHPLGAYEERKGGVLFPRSGGRRGRAPGGRGRRGGQYESSWRTGLQSSAFLTRTIAQVGGSNPNDGCGCLPCGLGTRGTIGPPEARIDPNPTDSWWLFCQSVACRLGVVSSPDSWWLVDLDVVGIPAVCGFFDSWWLTGPVGKQRCRWAASLGQVVRWGGGALANFMYEKGSRFLDTFSPYSFLRT